MGRAEFRVPGSVVRITMQDFMTYRHETIWPGPAFNVTVGPNGSGKSSIVTALSICLGGDLSSLNRQSELSSLVNTEGDAQEAVVEVELFTKDKKNKVVKAQIRAQGGNVPMWSIDGVRCSKKELLVLAESLQIQPGNLCQFLPQDVVRDFPTMDNQQIFYSTVKAVGDVGLLGTYDKLKSLQKEVECLEEQVEVKQNTLNDLDKRNNRLEKEKATYNKRKEAEKKKTEIENAIKWKLFGDLRKSVKDTRDKERDLKSKMTELEKTRKPIKDFLAEYDAKNKGVRDRMEATDKEYNAACSRVEDYDTSELEDQLDRLVDQEKDLAAQEQSRVNHKGRIQVEIRELTSQVAALEADPRWPGLDALLTEKMGRRAKHENNLQRSEQSMAEYANHQASLGREVERLERQARELQDKKERKLKTLEKENLDAYRGVLWLRDNRGLFRKPVHDPIMLALDVKNMDYARYVETHIGRADLEGFVCEDPDDVNTLTSELREKQKLRRINVFHSSPDPPDTFRHPYSRDEMQKFAFVEYISNMYDAPDAVNAYLCRQKNLHQVPVFREENQNSALLKSKFLNYYIGVQKFNVRKSKYSGELSTGTDDIGGKRVIRLAGTVDREEMDRITSQLETRKKLREQNDARQETVSRTCDRVKEEIAKLNDEILDLRGLKKEYSSKQSELAMKKRTLEQLVEPKFDMNTEKQRIRSEKRRVVKALSQQMVRMQELARASVEKEMERRTLHLALQNIESENSESKERLAGVERELETAKAEHSEVEARWDRDKRALQEKHSECRKATGILSEDVKYKPPEAWQAKFDAIGTTDINVLGAMLDEQEGELQHIKKVPDKVMEDIETLAKKLEQARKEKEGMEESMKNKSHEAIKMRRRWIFGVETLVEKINDSFGNMMANMGYSGQVSLKQGDRDIDFNNYGIRIQVRFRSGQELQELSKGTQSGGEKSVTTAVYMMALQELTQVPFRCVDEINQGMDEKNERAVWSQLLKVCRQHQAQYFYMAPKFPYSLPFDDQVTMLICNNGNVGPKESHKTYKTSKFVDSARKKRRRS